MFWGLSDSQVSLCVGVYLTARCLSVLGSVHIHVLVCWGLSESHVSLCVWVCLTARCLCVLGFV